MYGIEYGVFVNGEEDPRFVSTSEASVAEFVRSLPDDLLATSLVMWRWVDDVIDIDDMFL